jgi:hypothetical protein
MGKVKKYWDNMTQSKKEIILKNNLLWNGLKKFPYRFIPNDVRDILKQEMNNTNQEN